MYWLYLFLIFSVIKIVFAHVQLFNTENALSTQSYDCVYYTNVTAANNENIPYCIRTNQSVSLNRSFSTITCENSGKEWTFRNLKKMNVSQDEVSIWSSSIEMADRYATYLATRYVDFVYCLSNYLSLSLRCLHYLL